MGFDKSCKSGMCTLGKRGNAAVVAIIAFFLSVLASVMALGGLLFDYVIGYWLHKDIPFVLDVVFGALCSPFLVPAAVITFVASCL